MWSPPLSRFQSSLQFHADTSALHHHLLVPSLNRSLLHFFPLHHPHLSSSLTIFLLALPPSPPFPSIPLFSLPFHHHHLSFLSSSTCPRCCFHIKRQLLYPESLFLMCVSINWFSHITSNFKHK